MARKNRVVGARDQYDDGNGVLAHRAAGRVVHTARIAGGREGTPEGATWKTRASTQPKKPVCRARRRRLRLHERQLFEGPAWNKKICEQLTAITKAPTVTTAGAMVACLVAGGHKKVDVVTPYVALTNERLKQFAEAHGIEVATLGTFDMLDMFDHAKVLPEEIYAKVKEITTPDADAVFVACTQLRALEVLDTSSAISASPYSAVQASAWQAYAAMNVDPKIMDCGSC
jgi:hypothetical protein